VSGWLTRGSLPAARAAIVRSAVPHLRIALDARIPADQWGGVQQVTQGLCSGLAAIRTDDEFIVVTYPDGEDWLRPFLGGRVGLEVVPPATGRSRARRAFDALSARSPRLAGSAASMARPMAGSLTKAPKSDGRLEGMGVDVVHFLTPGAMLTSIPSIYQPHDLQHVHLPELFSPMRRRYRDATYRAFAEQASIVAVMTEWGREDLVRELGIPRRKVAVVPWAPVAGLPVATTEPREPPNLPESYAFYPAQTWPHKNHIRLLQALAILRARGYVVPFVSTGRQNEHFGAIRAEVERLGLADQVHFLGYVDDATLDAVFRRARLLVFPSLFEGWGIPIVEAFAYGVPVAASNATVIPEVAGAAALLFDPKNPVAIASAMENAWTHDALRAVLVRQGHTAASRLSWTRTAATFVALYRRVAGQAVDAGAARLLEPPTLVA
jgi:glycosyltransferase involved in cell wall biosynthesis